MSDRIVLYHNARCSKSRRALAMLRERGIEPEIVEYLKTPPSRSRILRLIGRLDGPPHSLLRTNEAPYRNEGLSADSSRSAIADAIARNPILLERPVVVRGERAVVARPPERVLELLGS